MHRDVAEHCDRGLISISMGCEAIFVVGVEDPEGGKGDNKEQTIGSKIAAIRLRSGDAIYMSGASRFAWHGVPHIIPQTCPDWLQDWPAESDGGEYAPWKGWMAGKRINLNVRQIFE